ncbi:MAG: precorrin-4 C(11)-methyltransferase [Candidatus Electrothrix sp. GW3-4]|uniref:precorrin-4 C(11)-methyltransferase n=1 Tax=Candidatus Electrothrix sp. GW3-4 TaxID=3126740 RepID=UPI0030CCD0CB
MSTPVVFLGAGPGDPELITVKGRRLLDEADVIVYAGSLVNPVLLDGVQAEIHDSASMTLDEVLTVLCDAWQAGKKAVRLHTGDPAIYGATREQMQGLSKKGIPYQVVPGVSSALAAAAALQAELTVPEVSQTVIFTRQAGRTPVPEQESLRNLAAIQASMCIFLSVSMIDKVVEELIAGGYSGDTPIAVVEKASWPNQHIIRGTLADIAAIVRASDIRKTAMIVVGQALSDDPTAASKLYDAGFSHGYRKSSK